MTETQSGYGPLFVFIDSRLILKLFLYTNQLDKYKNLGVKIFLSDTYTFYMRGPQDGRPLQLPRQGMGLKFHPAVSVSKLSHQIFKVG